MKAEKESQKFAQRNFLRNVKRQGPSTEFELR